MERSGRRGCLEVGHAAVQRANLHARFHIIKSWFTNVVWELLLWRLER